MVYLYMLSYPKTKDNRIYIGQTIDPYSRLWSHINKSKNNPDTYSSRWIKSWLKSGVEPKMTILLEADNKGEGDFTEVFLIKLFREMGANLTNTCVGGSTLGSGPDHPAYGKKRPRELVDRIVEANRKYFAKRALRMKGTCYSKGRAPVNKGKRKISLEQAEQIKVKLAAGVSTKQLFQEYDTNATTISCIKNGKYFALGWGYESSANSYKNKEIAA